MEGEADGGGGDALDFVELALERFGGRAGGRLFVLGDTDLLLYQKLKILYRTLLKKGSKIREYDSKEFLQVSVILTSEKFHRS